MDRRKFVATSSLMTIAIGAFGRVTMNDGIYRSNSVSATDILGPFYRPNAPFRQNLNPAGFAGEELHVRGRILKEDGTPLQDGLLEVWQCRDDGFYDNVSDEFDYRCSQKITKDGKYHFITAKPVPEPVDETLTVFRPPHIHLLISAKEHQDLITQIYFQGDPHLDTDPSTNTDLAINRILPVKKIGDKKSEVVFDLTLRKEYVPEDSVYHRIAGVYKMSNGSLMEFYRDGDLLFYKTNGQIWGGLAYAGNNTFGSKEDHTEARFELLAKGGAKVWFRFSRRRETRLEGKKVVAYE